jgi:hypothetical protein
MLPVRSRFAPVLAAGTLALAACGSGGGPSTSAQTGSGPGPGTVIFATCMREHGIAQFPDPGGPRPAGSRVSILGAALPPTINLKAPAFQSALKVCMRRFLAGHPRPKVSAAQKAAALEFAHCVRTHGVPDFPDPEFPSGGGIGIPEPAGANPDSPAFRHAQQVCGNP